MAQTILNVSQKLECVLMRSNFVLVYTLDSALVLFLEVLQYNYGVVFSVMIYTNYIYFDLQHSDLMSLMKLTADDNPNFFAINMGIIGDIKWFTLIKTQRSGSPSMARMIFNPINISL